MAENFYENENYILNETATSSARRGLEPRNTSYHYNQGNFFSDEHGGRELNSSNGYYQFYEDKDKRQSVKLNRENSLKEVYGTSYSKVANYRSASRRQTSSSSPPRREGEVIYTNVYKTHNTNMTTPKQLQSGEYEQIREPPVVVTTKPYTRTVETATCCCSCMDFCCCFNGRKKETDVTQETQYEQIQKRGDSYDSESWDSYDVEYDDRHRMIRNRESVTQNTRYARPHANASRRQPEYNSSKRHVGVQMNTQYVLHYNNSQQMTIKPKMRNASSQTITPLFEYLPPRTAQIDIIQPPKFELVPHVRRAPSPEPLGPVVVSRVHKSPSPEVLIRSQPIPHVPEDGSPEVTPRHSSYPRGKVPKDTSNPTGPANIHIHHQHPPVVLDGTKPVLYGKDYYTYRPTSYGRDSETPRRASDVIDSETPRPALHGRDSETPRPATPKGPKVVPFIGDPPDLDQTYVTAYFEYKKKKKPKNKKKQSPVDNIDVQDNIVVQESKPEPPLSIPVKEPPPEPEITYYCDPEPEPEPYTPPTPSPPSTPPRTPKKPKQVRIKKIPSKYGIRKYKDKEEKIGRIVPKMKSKSMMTRVGGGWMKVEHHRYHHIPLTVYEHPRAFDDKFLYTKSKYTPDKERVPIAYKKYREMVVRNGKLG